MKGIDTHMITDQFVCTIANTVLDLPKWEGRVTDLSAQPLSKATDSTSTQVLVRMNYRLTLGNRFRIAVHSVLELMTINDQRARGEIMIYA